VGAHELARLPPVTRLYAGAYSNLGPLNCVPDLSAVSQECARLLEPGGTLVFTVIGRICPWEIIALRTPAALVAHQGAIRSQPRTCRHEPRTIWTRYYGPREFYRAL